MLTKPLPDKLYQTLCMATNATRVRVNQKNPHGRHTSWYPRYERYKKANTLMELLRLGARSFDLTYDVLKGAIVLLGPFKKRNLDPEKRIPR